MRKISMILVIAKRELAKAEIIKNEILSILPANSKCNLFEEYQKIDGCYKMVVEIDIPETDSEAVFNYKMLTLSASLARPWLIFFQDNFGTELIFNKTDASSYNRPGLSNIIWGHIQVPGNNKG